VLVEVVLEDGRLAGCGCFLGRCQSAEALDIDGDGRQDVLDVGLSLSSVAAVAHAVAVGELVDGSLHPGAHRVAGLPLGCLLLGTDAELQVAEFSWGKPTVRALSAVVVHWVRARQGRHWLVVNRATISGAAVGEEVG
jgi:hypothetical protein